MLDTEYRALPRLYFRQVQTQSRILSWGVVALCCEYLDLISTMTSCDVECP